MIELVSTHPATGVQFIDIPTYPDGTPLVAWGSVPDFIDRLLLRPASLASFMGAMFFVDALAERGKPIPELILPLMPGSRQDRLNTRGDYLFTAKSIAREINARNFPRVTLLDPHSEVSAALVDRSKVVHAVDCIATPPGKYAAVVSPDAGAEKRASDVALKLGVPLIHAWKTRDISTGAISGFGMQTPPIGVPVDALVLVVDDLCDGGGTFIGLGGLLKERGFRAHLWTTHGLYTKGTAALLEHYGHLYCTDSAAGARTGVIEINVCERLLKGT